MIRIFSFSFFLRGGGGGGAIPFATLGHIPEINIFTV